MTVCGNPSDPSTCALIRVPTGGRELFILNSEFRIPLPIKKGFGLVAFYDGGNVFQHVGFSDFGSNYTNTVGIGLRYATPIGRELAPSILATYLAINDRGVQSTGVA